MVNNYFKPLCFKQGVLTKHMILTCLHMLQCAVKRVFLALLYPKQEKRTPVYVPITHVGPF